MFKKAEHVSNRHYKFWIWRSKKSQKRQHYFVPNWKKSTLIRWNRIYNLEVVQNYW